MDNPTGNVPELEPTSSLQQGISGDNHEVYRRGAIQEGDNLSQSPSPVPVPAENSDLESGSGGVVASNLLRQPQRIHSNTLVSEDATADAVVGNITGSPTLMRNQNSEGATAQVVELSAERPYEPYSEYPTRSSRDCTAKCGIIQNLSPTDLVEIKKVLFEILNTIQQRNKLKKQIEYWYGVKLGWLEGMWMEMMNHNHIGGKCLVCFLRDALLHIGGNDLVRVLDGVLSEQENQTGPPLANSADAFSSVPECLNGQMEGGRSEHDGPSFQRYRDKSGYECLICDKCFDDTESTDCMTLPCSHKVHTKCLFSTELTKCPICKSDVLFNLPPADDDGVVAAQSNSAGAFFPVPDSLSDQQSGSFEHGGQSFQKYRDKSGYECCICEECFDTEYVTIPCSHVAHTECLDDGVTECPICKESIGTTRNDE